MRYRWSRKPLGSFIFPIFLAALFNSIVRSSRQEGVRLGDDTLKFHVATTPQAQGAQISVKRTCCSSLPGLVATGSCDIVDIVNTSGASP